MHVNRLPKTPFRTKTAIDIDAAYGSIEIHKQCPEATHLLIEPLEEFRNDLQKIAQQHKAHYINAAAGAKSGKASLNVHPNLVGGSLLTF